MYSVGTVFGVLLIGAALAANVLYIELYQNDKNDDNWVWPQIGSISASTVIVLYIIVTIAFFRPYSSFSYMFGTCLLLIAGLAGEVALSAHYIESTGDQVGAYMLAGTNALLRLFLLIQVRCDEPLTTIGDVIRQAARVAVKTGQPVKDAVKQAAAPLATVAPENLLQKVRDAIGSVQIDDTDEKGKALKRTIKDAILSKAFDVQPKARGGRR